MKHFSKEVVLLLVVQSLILITFTFLLTTKTITNVSALETEGVGVYWDSDCTDRVSVIYWGTLTPGSAKNIAVYIRNEGAESMRLILSTTNWNPQEASGYLNLEWNYPPWRWMNLGEILQITLSLSVSRYIEGISSFSFDILVTGSDSLLGDVNGDGKVTYADVYVTTQVYSGAWPWPAPEADVNGDGKVTYADVYLILFIYNSNVPF